MAILQNFANEKCCYYYLSKQSERMEHQPNQTGWCIVVVAAAEGRSDMTDSVAAGTNDSNSNSSTSPVWALAPSYAPMLNNDCDE